MRSFFAFSQNINPIVKNGAKSTAKKSNIQSRIIAKGIPIIKYVGFNFCMMGKNLRLIPICILKIGLKVLCTFW